MHRQLKRLANAEVITMLGFGLHTLFFTFLLLFCLCLVRIVFVMMSSRLSPIVLDDDDNWGMLGLSSLLSSLPLRFLALGRC